MTLLVTMKVNDCKTGKLYERQDFLYLDVEECSEENFGEVAEVIERDICGRVYPEIFTKDSVTRFEYTRLADELAEV